MLLQILVFGTSVLANPYFRPLRRFSENDLVGNGDNLESADISSFSYDELAASINESINPCDDFYSYVCSGWKANNPIPENLKSFTQMKKLEDEVTKELEDIINEPIDKATSREQFLMKTFHHKCLDSLNSSNTIQLRQLLGRIRWLRANSFVLTDWLIEMNPTSVFYDIMVLPDDFNSTNNVISVMPSPPLMSFSAYFDPAYAQEYVAMRKSLFNLMDLLSHDDHELDLFDYSSHEVLRRIESLLKIDQNMAKIAQETEFDTSTVNVAVFELGERLGSIDWIRYLSSIFPPEMAAELPYQMVSVKQVATMLKYEELLMSLDPLELWDYLEWKVIFHYAPYLGDRYAQLMEKYEKQVYGVEKRDRARDCTEQTISYFPDVVSAIWLQRHFDFSTVGHVTKIVDLLRNSFLELLKTNDWMDLKTKEKARKKAHAIIPFVGFDKKTMQENEIRKKYMNLFFDNRSSFYYVNQILERWNQLTNFEKLNQQNRRDSFESRATETNAFYDPNQNQIAILAGILRPPFYNEKWPEVINLAAIGMVIGHEITHAFDDYGAYFDENGSRNNWWAPETMAQFEEKAHCIEDQYSHITIIDGVKINGKRTKGENIADNGGMRATIKTVSSILGPPSSNPGAWKQFFSAYAFTWCSNVRDHSLLTELASESHSPATARVNTVLGNQLEFSEAFSCPSGSNMNPNRKCVVW